MSNQAKKSYLRIVKRKYKNQNHVTKGQILDQGVIHLGLNRKSLIRALNKPLNQGKKRSGRPLKYDKEVLFHLEQLYILMGKMCSKNMSVALPLWLDFYKAPIKPKAKKALKEISPSSIDRLLKPLRARLRRKQNSGTRSNKWMKHNIPLKRLDWNVTTIGHVEADTVAHCGDSMSGSFIWSLTLTDIHTGWTENRAMWGKSAFGVVTSMSDIERYLPFTMKTLSTDNGSEFLNHQLLRYLETSHYKRDHKIILQRGRPYRKNDQCYVEQKNFTHVRELLGYTRYDNKKCQEVLNDLYRTEHSLLKNFFTPSFKLIRKTRLGSKIKKEYEKPKTPLQRVLDCPDVSLETKNSLLRTFKELDPFYLKTRLQEKLKKVDRINSQAYFRKVG